MFAPTTRGLRMKPKRLDRMIRGFLAKWAHRTSREGLIVFGYQTAKVVSDPVTIRILAPGLHRLFPRFRKKRRQALREFYISITRNSPGTTSKETIYRFDRRRNHVEVGKCVLALGSDERITSDESLEELPVALPDTIKALYHDPRNPFSWLGLRFEESASRHELFELIDFVCSIGSTKAPPPRL